MDDVQEMEVVQPTVETPLPANQPSAASLDVPNAESTLAVELDPAFDGRLQPIRDHRRQAQGNSNTLMACLAGVNSDLIEANCSSARHCGRLWLSAV